MEVVNEFIIVLALTVIGGCIGFVIFILKHEKEHNLFVEITGSDYVPAFMIVEDHESENPTSHVFVPDKHFNEITEGVEIIKKYML